MQRSRRMPGASEILAGLTRSAEEGIPLALVWHAALAVLFAAVALRWRPTRRFIAAASSIPLLSVATMAFVHGNAFNAAVFTVAAVAVLVLSAAVDSEPAVAPSVPLLLLGVALVAFALFYPHFLASWPRWIYLVAAPVGVVPCPTLALLCGVGLMSGGVSRPWAALVACLATFYAVFGAVRLAVTLDFALLFGAIALLLGGVVFPRRFGLRRGDDEIALRPRGRVLHG